MSLQLRKSNRTRTKIRMAVAGPSGSGKSYSSLLIAKGISSRWEDIAVLDTEHGSADLYAHLGSYNVLTLEGPMSPEKYIKAIELCEKEGIKVLIIDSLSHCWEYLLDVHSNMVGNSFTNWGKITPRQNALIQKILSSPMHIICTMRTKQDYVLNQKNGKYVPEKVGLKTIQREGVDYEFTLVLDIDIKHQATASKDRTNLFSGKPAFELNEQIGKTILNWCNSGSAVPTPVDFTRRIKECQSIKELIKLYKSQPGIQKEYGALFTERRRDLEEMERSERMEPTPSFPHISQNGLNQNNHE